MIEKLKPEQLSIGANRSQGQGAFYCSGAGPQEVIAKINEIVDVVNALIDGDFLENQDGWDFVRKLRENLREAQMKVKK